ncbi:molybdopterin molybdotransferase MoeA [Kaistia geumhonensis]|uniref:Molybdopterin molybdenumtransferase n=1 Tax=Kaistia geumhonensis TaxID=410839 RepID=A0ABU0M203_9HYPH|nr:gephyrin-like molybdotransferase Glp [Kaistia geumhonensis]MCX5479807.1 molybdopterin molybdotransferase MoeA [Kaistia geumhonensis]MDQ0514968.1 molybdopterin molybdotransferase [Kaistia geumhonensis]
MKPLLPVEEAIRRVLDGVEPLAAEEVPLAAAVGRVLAEPLHALRTQPPHDVSAMDGYALRAADIASTALPATLRVIGSAPAGHAFAGLVGPGEAVRIFTGAGVPDGADAILLQEDAAVLPDGRIEAREAVRPGQHIRRRGLDFCAGDRVIEPGIRLGMRQLALAAALDHAKVPVRRKPVVAIIATGDELVPPGSGDGGSGIVASNGYGIGALVESLGGLVRDLGIVRDDRAALAAAIDAAMGADVLVTIGGASVGDHDLVRDVLQDRGMTLDFWRIAMRPGKPLLFGRLKATRVLSLPGNPVSSLVCALLFLRPLVEALLGMPFVDPTVGARLGSQVRANDVRQDYIRARLTIDDDGGRVATPLERQDSAMLSAFHRAECLIVRPPHADAEAKGARCRVVILP